MPFKKKETSSEVYERVHEMLMTRGIVAAVESLISVAEDPKAPGPARATAGSSLLRAAGMFAVGKAGGKEKPASEMSPEEISEALAKLHKRLAASQNSEEDAEDDGIFG